MDLNFEEEKCAMNIQLNYLYRDAWNFKKFHSVILSDIIVLEQIETYLKDQTFFIPSEVGLPDLQEDIFKSYDHIWHEIEFLELTDQQPTVAIDASALLANFKKANSLNWNEGEVFTRKGLM